MDKKGKSLRWLPYVAAPVIFLLVSMLYFAPQFSGEKLDMHDVTQYVGASADIERHVEQYGEDPQWTGSSFSGMPSYMIDFKVPAWLIRHASKLPVRAMGEPAVLIFTAMLCFWLMTLLWKVNPWVGIVPALAYGFSTYTILIIGAGHISKVWAMAYIPLLIGAIVYTYRGRHLWFGAALAALAASLEISANHPQITYYFLLVIVALLINEFVRSYRHRVLPRFWKASGALLLAAVLAVGSNFAPLYFTAQHAADTTRGGSELAEGDAGGKAAQRGLDLEYATAWSYGRTESFNLFIPNLMGGSSAQPFSPDGPVAEVLANFGARPADLPIGTYWGDQPGTAGPTYLGAAVVFLAVLGLFVLRGSRKWWLLAVSLLALFLSWGSNMMWFTELCFKILPGYNKFRAVSTALVIVQWTFPLLACLLLSELWKGEIPARKIRRGLAWATGITGGIALLFALFGPKMFGFSAPGDYPLLYNIAAHSGFNEAGARQFADYVSDAMSAERAKMLRADAWRSLLFVLVSAGLVLLYAKGRMKRGILTACFAGLVCLDLIPVDLRYLSWDDFVPARRTQLYPTEADKEILKDTTPGYRVANFAVNTFSDATTSYFHRSVGGYHGAKLQRYQDLIDRHLVPMNMEVYNMLNTRYFIVPEMSGRLEAQFNPDANGAAWFVAEVIPSDTPNEEIDALNRIDTKRQAVADRRFTDRLPVTGTADTAASIRLTDYRVNRLTYEYDSATEGIAVFSEIYYDKGWKAYVDGTEAPYFRADYVLRAMALPAGHHTVEFVFRAPKFREASAVTLAGSLIILIGFAAAAIYAVWDDRRKKDRNENNNILPEALRRREGQQTPYQTMAKAENTKSLRRKVRNSYIISTISIALVLFLLGSVGYLIFNAVRATDLMKENVAIHLMIKQGTSDERIAEIGRELGAHEAVKEVTFVPKAVAAENFKEQIGSDFVEFLAFNPLPDAYEVKLHAQYSDKDYVRKFEKEAASWNGIEEVVYQRAVVEQIGSNINKFNLVLLLFGGALLVIALILLNNTIRLTIYSKRYLINTMKLVGASKWFIMKPFLLRSILHGVYAWLIAAAMFLALVAGLGEGLPEVTFLAESRPVYYVLCGMLLLGILISALFTLFAVNKFVRMNTTKINLY